jgi:predicted nucleotidyltransferase
MMSELFDRHAITALLEDLARRLERRGVRASIYIVGGAAISLVYDARRSTRDVDSVVIAGHGPLIDEVRAIARERNLPTTWLNEQASVYVSRHDDPGRTRVFDHPYLSVAAASAEHLLAMKLLAARASDVDDLRLLLGVLGITNVEGATRILSTVFPDEPMSDRARLLVEDLLDRR